MTEDERFAVLVHLLIEIRDAVQALVPVVEDETTAICGHPEETRISLATMREPGRWVCGVCKYDNVQDLVRN